MTTPNINRRRLLGGTLGVLAAGPLVACGGTGSRSDNRLRAAFSVSGSRESLDPHTGSLFVDQARSKALFDTLVGYAQDMSPVPRLAESWEPDASGKRWRIRLRAARFHDNRPVTAEDVLYSYRRIADPATGSPAQPQFSGVDFKASEAVSERELVLVLGEPDFSFPTAWGAPATEIVPANAADFGEPIGSGPFRFASFETGGSAVFERFEGHFDGPPELSELEFVPVNEENARVSALLSGQVHYAHDIGANSVEMVRKDGRGEVLSAPRSTMQAVAFKVDRPPFDDNRVLRAVLSGVDREALLGVVLNERGELGNDLFGKGLEYYPEDIPQRERDVDRARKLLREAGAEGIGFELRTSSADPYFEPAANLIAEQLGEIGIKVTPRVGPSETHYSDIKKHGVAGHTRTATLPITTYLSKRLRAASVSANYTGYDSAEFNRLFDDAVATADERKRTELLTDAQRHARNHSGFMVWGFSDWNVAVSSDVGGLEAATPNSLNWARFDGAELG
ncbi:MULTISPECIES: ABC transporter substrate-binding protein [unclassified Actinopolyspora]|uniref:ABC transporter substrate-binding protein n=1 Tax=unclassified Actinopolyspora TaxID=2639451 RepID=UPI001A98805C